MVKPRGMSVKDRTGLRYGMLTVLRREANAEGKDGPQTRWLCRCDCGGEKVILGSSLEKTARGRPGTRSCGCLMKGQPPTHGKSHSRVYRIWAAMTQRCLNPKFTTYASYGGRGITVCERWREFANFYADMGDPPTNFTLDRIDNSLGYSPENCRWASRKTQGNNRRTNVFVEFNGQCRTVTEWGELTGLGKSLIRHRLARGWTVEQTLTSPRTPASRPYPKRPVHSKIGN